MRNNMIKLFTVSFKKDCKVREPGLSGQSLKMGFYVAVEGGSE